MSPWELLAVYLVLPVLVIGGWLHHRYETDGPSIPEFEAWCARERPVLFALRGPAAASRAFAAALSEAIRGDGAETKELVVEHRAGRFPWTSYVFKLSIEVEDAGDEAVVRVRAERGTVKRKREDHPDLAGILERITPKTRGAEAVWLHTELRDGDEVRGEARRGRGWIATRGESGLTAYELAAERPTWVQP
ncbi:MAG: hypothetical protein U0414_32945 [Polyangiaceae bacterium]